MRREISITLSEAQNLDQVRDKIVTLFERTRKKTGSERIGYVAGIIGSDGPEKVEENRKKLADNTERIRATNDFPIFSATDVFSEELFIRLEELRLSLLERRQAFIKFWREVLELGRVTDIFMTPRWEESEGARDEHETAQRLSIKVHYVEGAGSR